MTHFEQMRHVVLPQAMRIAIAPTLGFSVQVAQAQFWPTLLPEMKLQPNPEALSVFVSNGRQGINFRRGVWHHPLLALTPGDFLVADRLGPGNNCEAIDIAGWQFGIALT